MNPKQGYALEIKAYRTYVSVAIVETPHRSPVKHVLVDPPSFFERLLGRSWEDKVVVAVRKFTTKLEILKRERAQQDAIEEKLEEEATRIAKKLQRDITAE